MLEIVKEEPAEWDASFTVVTLRGTVDEVEELDEIAGLIVTKIQTAQHDGAPATLFSLSGDGASPPGHQRTTGRLVVRNHGDTGLPEDVDQLEWTRTLDSEEEVEHLRYEVSTRGELPYGYRMTQIRKIDVGDTIRSAEDGYGNDSEVVAMVYGTGPADATGLGGVLPLQPMVTLKLKHLGRQGTGELPFGLNYLVARKQQ